MSMRNVTPPILPDLAEFIVLGKRSSSFYLFIRNIFGGSHQVSILPVGAVLIMRDTDKLVEYRCQSTKG